MFPKSNPLFLRAGDDAISFKHRRALRAAVNDIFIKPQNSDMTASCGFFAIAQPHNVGQDTGDGYVIERTKRVGWHQGYQCFCRFFWIFNNVSIVLQCSEHQVAGVIFKPFFVRVINEMIDFWGRFSRFRDFRPTSAIRRGGSFGWLGAGRSWLSCSLRSLRHVSNLLELLHPALDHFRNWDLLDECSFAGFFYSWIISVSE